jgi:hypothetical protein
VQKTGDFGQVLNDDSKTISLMKTPWGWTLLSKRVGSENFKLTAFIYH